MGEQDVSKVTGRELSVTGVLRERSLLQRQIRLYSGARIWPGAFSAFAQHW